MYGYYPLWKWSYLAWIIPALVGMTTMTSTAGEKLIIAGVTIPIVLVSLFVAICLIGFAYQVNFRYRIREGITYTVSIHKDIEYYGVVAFRVDEDIDCDSVICEAMPTGTDLTDMLLSSEARLKRVAPKVKLKNLGPVVFLTYRKKGSIKSWDKRNEILRRLHGIKRNHWCEVEKSSPKIMREQMIHELEHAMITSVNPHWDGARQHKAMEEAMELEKITSS